MNILTDTKTNLYLTSRQFFFQNAISLEYFLQYAYPLKTFFVAFDYLYVNTLDENVV